MSKSQEKLNSELDDAIGRSNLEEVRSLLEDGADIEYRDPLGWSPLINAAWVAADDIVELLISKGADVHYKNPEGHTALSKARSVGHNDYGHDAVIAILESADGSEN